MTDETILLECIIDNPYQPRTVDDAEHIERLGRSIAADGLLQKPTARHTLAGAELAFGHSRRKAFEWLRNHYEAEGLPDRYRGYTVMPLNFEKLSDEDMYRQAVSENVQRKDLNPVETARAMMRYRDEFGKNSDEIGALFGMSGATVRGKIRLLELPDGWKDALQKGEISEGTARLGLALQKIDLDAMSETLADIQNGEFPEDAVDSALRDSKIAMHIYALIAPWLKEKKFPSKFLPELTVNQALKAEGSKSTYSNKSVMQNLINDLAAGTKVEDLRPYFGDGNSIVALLLAPPACAACDHMATVNSRRYCGLRLCFERKSIAWKQSELKKAEKALGIAIYNAETDGDCIEIHRYEEKGRKWFDKRNANLRLRASGNSYNAFDGVPSGVAVVMIGKAAEKEIKEEVILMAFGSDTWEKRDAIRKANHERISRFGWDVVTPLIQPLVGITQVKFLEQILDDLSEDGDYPDEVGTTSGMARKGLTGKPLIDELQKRIAFSALFNALDYEDLLKYQDSAQPVTEFVKGQQERLTTWGVKLPKDWLAQAARYEPEMEAVAVETKKK